jgi:hypothetical protein
MNSNKLAPTNAGRASLSDSAAVGPAWLRGTFLDMRSIVPTFLGAIIIATLVMGWSLQFRITTLTLKGKPARRFLSVEGRHWTVGRTVNLSSAGSRREEIYTHFGLRHTGSCRVSIDE